MSAIKSFPIECPHDNCDGNLEAMSVVYLDVDKAEFDADGNVILHEVSFSHLNDELHGNPVNMESEFKVLCTEGHQFAWDLSDELRAQLAPQPIGNAPRTKGQRGGMEG